MTLLLIINFGYTQSSTKALIKNKFFEIEQNISELQEEMAKLRKDVREIEVRSSVPVIREEINRLVKIPEITHEIILQNGTVVQGKIIHEDLDKIIVMTQIGQLTISKKNIKISRKAEKPMAKCTLDGPVTEQVFPDKRVYTGKLKNVGIRRADFPRIIFEIFDENTNVLATDSIFVSGSYHMYQTGVQTDCTINPGDSFPFECSVEIPKENKVSYYIKTIKWENFE